MKTTSIRNCQSCGKGFADGDIVYFVQLDNNIVCPECAYKHVRREKRIVGGTNFMGRDQRFLKLADLLTGKVELSAEEVKFLDWISGCDMDTMESLFGLLEKCLGVRK